MWYIIRSAGYVTLPLLSFLVPSWTPSNPVGMRINGEGKKWRKCHVIWKILVSCDFVNYNYNYNPIQQSWLVACSCFVWHWVRLWGAGSRQGRKNLKLLILKDFFQSKGDTLYISNILDCIIWVSNLKDCHPIHTQYIGWYTSSPL